jgi:hypothetical protein
MSQSSSCQTAPERPVFGVAGVARSPRRRITVEIMLLIVLGSSLWMAVDAANIGAHRLQTPGLASTHPAAWFAGGLLMWIIVFPCYLFARPKMIAARDKAMNRSLGGTSYFPANQDAAAPAWPAASSLWSATPLPAAGADHASAPIAPPADTRPGWYSDPAQRGEVRWWDGSRWTNHVASQGVTRHDPL